MSYVTTAGHGGEAVDEVRGPAAEGGPDSKGAVELTGQPLESRR
jgi:hypothetical protein